MVQPTAAPPFVEEVELHGHIIDSLLLPKILDAAERLPSERPSDADMSRMVEHLQMEPLFV